MQQIFQINAFTSDLFSGNPAIVCPLAEWLDDTLMQKIAAESRLTCAFFVGSDGHYRLRWFTPNVEIEEICGHGTVAAAFVIFNELADKSEEIAFHVPAGELRVRPRHNHYVLDLPALHPTPRLAPDNLRRPWAVCPGRSWGHWTSSPSSRQRRMSLNSSRT
jgi:PhzF family phenazine biosynthesis protein